MIVDEKYWMKRNNRSKCHEDRSCRDRISECERREDAGDDRVKNIHDDIRCERSSDADDRRDERIGRIEIINQIKKLLYCNNDWLVIEG